MHISSIQQLQSLCEKLNTAPIINKTSPAAQPRRAGVAAILRWKCSDDQSSNLLDPTTPSFDASEQILHWH
ncbi:unnamed protein product [Absidia cylindrospora]